MKNGSKYMKIRNDDSVVINRGNIQPEIRIIINLIGLCDNEVSRFDLIDDNNHKIKILFKYFTWHSDIPLFECR